MGIRARRTSLAMVIAVVTAITSCSKAPTNASTSTSTSGRALPTLTLSTDRGGSGTRVSLSARHCPPADQPPPTVFFHDSDNMTKVGAEKGIGIRYLTRTQTGLTVSAEYTIRRDDSTGQALFVVFCGSGTADAYFVVEPAR